MNETPDAGGQTRALPGDLEAAVQASLRDLERRDAITKLFARDASLWTGADEGRWLGWLDIPREELAHAPELQAIAADLRNEGFTHALLLGMGGSSLAPEVFKATLGVAPGFPDLYVLDSTDPAQIRAFERKVPLPSTIFIVSSKSGSTLEPNIFKQYFFERAGQAFGPERAGSRFIAITDPGSKLEQVAESDRFRLCLHGLPSIGGRYSALSDFGLFPLALIGADVPRLLDGAIEMMHACAPSAPIEDNPGAVLGAVLGTLATLGRDKLTLIASPRIASLGAWLEQLIAESTGKDGKGIIPVDREPIGGPEVYGRDRLFVYMRVSTDPLGSQDEAVDRLQRAGQPVFRIAVADPYALGREMYRWEIATAVAGALLGIHPFNQPDVEASKVATRRLMDEVERNGSLPPESPIFEANGIQLFTDLKNAAELSKANPTSLTDYLRAHLGPAKAGDYVAFLAYLEMNDEHDAMLQAMRLAVRDRTRLATCLGYGPRFLHSTGQAYKGGPNTGVFLQMTCDHPTDLPVPGQKYTFGAVEAAQARGDFEVLAERNRRVLRVHLGADVPYGLRVLGAAVAQAIQDASDG
jgi:transaldolase / glucose-6-phosphate isomerase